MSITVGINGMGRIGRCTLAHVIESGRNDIEVAKINATGPIETAAHLLRYDSVHGRFGGEITVAGDTMDLGRGPIKVFSTYNPDELDWTGCDVVLECSGKFNRRDAAAVHLAHGAKRVLVSAPAKGADRTVSSASTTTRCNRASWWYPTAPAPPTAWRRWPRSSTTRSASIAGS